MSVFGKLFGKGDSGGNDSAEGVFTYKILDRAQLKDGAVAHIYGVMKPGEVYDASIYYKGKDPLNKKIKHDEIECIIPAPNYTNEQKKALIACCLITQTNLGVYSSTVFEIPEELSYFHTPKTSRESLSVAWDIHDREEALRVMKYLAEGEGHTAFANEIYDKYITKKLWRPFKYKLIDNIELYEPILKRAYTISAEHLPEFMKQNGIQLHLKNEAHRELAESYYVHYVDEGTAQYDNAITHLAFFGMKKSIAKKITNFAAWDYGRCGYIGRYAAHAGYITEDEAWEHMLTAVRNAEKDYSNWQEYLGAYLIGRYIAYGNKDSEEFNDVLHFLLKNHYHSFYNKIPLRT
jgi:hypothetical protein